MCPAPQEIVDLVERFARNIDRYHRPDYNETQTRREFIDPFFVALGWDVDNRRGVAPQYREVIHEATVRDRGGAKAPDYCFRVGPERKFFVEAKKPAVDIGGDVHPAYQLRRYAWSAKLPLSILTDFEEFSVYDCRIPPKPTDKAATARILYIRYTDYPDRWDEIAAIFSRDAVWRGDYDRYAETTRGKRGTQEVDAAFLQEIERWREALARNIALRNPSLTVRELNFAVQKTIDRIIFLRICEDRDIEPYEQLKSVAQNGGVYANLLQLFRRADDRYNSGLFHFREERGRAEAPDTLTPNLTIDDKVLRDIINGLYYPASPYEFSVLSADILGNVYEQFLGSVIRLTPAHRAVVEQKPEVRKAGGVYYTPKYIVDYIVKNTVGKLCEGKTPAEIAKLRILDPACGSGSFLLGAYQYLLDYHRDWYVAHPTKHGRREIYQGKGGQWFLTTEEKKRILLNNIYGVDIDPQAVEVTKLSLLLKVLEGENADTLATQLALMPERALPDLASNIKCGNSLIGPDFYEGRQMPLLDDEEVQRINPFDWHAEFPEIMAAGGFDAVIGNPPYIRIQTMKEWAPTEVEFYKRRYVSASKGNYDIYVVFVERGLSLLNERGRLGFILPHKFFQAEFGEPIRKLLADRRALAEVVHFGAEQVFANATTYTCLLLLCAEPQEKVRFVSVAKLQDPPRLLDAISKREPNTNYAEALLPHPASGGAWRLSAGGAGKVLDALNRQPLTLGDIVRKIFVGLQTSCDKVYVLKVLEWREQTVLCYSDALGQQVEVERGLVKPFLMGKDVHRYAPLQAQRVVIFPYIIQGGRAVLMTQEFIRRHFPEGWRYLSANKETLSQRERGKTKGESFYAYIYPKNLAEFETKKLMTPEIALGCQMTYDAQGTLYHTTKVYSFVFNPSRREKDLYFLGILNSKLLWRFLQTTGYTLRGGYFTFKTEYLKPFPIRTINFDDPADAARHDRMVALVERMLDLHKRVAAAKTPTDKTLLQRQIDATDREIDRLVYELYGLTEEEIAIVEGTARD